MITKLLARWAAYEDKRLGLPTLGRAYQQSPVHFVLRIGPWMLKQDGLWRERFRVSHKGKNGKRAWQRVWPKQSK